MRKTLSLLTFTLLFFEAFAQKKDTVVYYLQNSWEIVSTKDSADLFLVILPPDTNVDKSLFVVNEFYKNGKIRLVGNSRTNDLNLKFQGTQIIFFRNGHKLRISNYDKGVPVGDVIEYYPNGKLYNIKTFTSSKKAFLKQFNDSTGVISAKDGTGKWIEFNQSFNVIAAMGQIDNGVEEGMWSGKINDSVSFENLFKRGKLISSSTIYKYKSDGDALTKVDTPPEFPGGADAFGQFLGHTIRYPAAAIENNTQGRVIISFVVEVDGTLTNIRITKGVGDSIDEEAIRVIMLSPKWKPGILNGKQVRVAYSVPIQFTLIK
jgi:TonB family protein